MAQIALSSHLAEVLPTLPTLERKRVLRALRKIRDRQFDTGLRVKKLQARPSVAVWEARFSDFGRVLFTYGSHTDRLSGEPETVAHCWTALFDHDDVPRELRRRRYETPEIMQWLFTDQIDEIEWGDKPLPDNPAADLEAIEKHFSANDRWDAYAELSSEFPPAWATPPENLPWYLEGRVSFDEWAANSSIPAELILTDEQLELLRKPLPVFLNGPAGSGKTTLALYRLLVIQENNPDAKVAFIAQNPRLVTHARKLYEALPARPKGAVPVDFLTYTELAANVLGKPLEEMRGQLVSGGSLRAMLRHRDLTNAERQIFETEIRAVLKGMLPPRNGRVHTKDICRLLSLKEYRDLKATWSVVSREQRQQVYRLAEQYQDELDQSVDLQDISTQALRRLFRSSESRLYDALVLDEVQDLTEKQLRVVMGTLKQPSEDQVFFAGDPTQMLNASGFGWRVPQALYYERQKDVPSPETLTRSFRAGAPTLRLAKALADALLKEGADVIALDPDKARNSGIPPLRVDPDAHVDEILAVGHPNVLILTESETTAERLREQWGHPFVWSVAEAKGLEADHVVLYKLPDRIRRIPGADSIQRQAARRANLRHYRLHYVAATRARQSVTAVAEAHPGGSLWEDPNVQKAAAALSIFESPWAKSPSRDEWHSRAKYYRDNEQWAAAGACFRNAGMSDWEMICSAFDEYMDKPAALYAIKQSLSSLSPKHAVFLLDYAHLGMNHDLQVWLFHHAGRKKEVGAIQAKHDEATGNWEMAAEYYEEQKDFKRSTDLYVKAEAWKSAARCFKLDNKKEWALICRALSKFDEPAAVVDYVRRGIKQLSEPPALFLFEQLGTIQDLDARTWLASRAGKKQRAETPAQHQKTFRRSHVDLLYPDNDFTIVVSAFVELLVKRDLLKEEYLNNENRFLSGVIHERLNIWNDLEKFREKEEISKDKYISVIIESADCELHNSQCDNIIISALLVLIVLCPLKLRCTYTIRANNIKYIEKYVSINAPGRSISRYWSTWRYGSLIKYSMFVKHIYDVLWLR